MRLTHLVSALFLVACGSGGPTDTGGTTTGTAGGTPTGTGAPTGTTSGTTTTVPTTPVTIDGAIASPGAPAGSDVVGIWMLGDDAPPYNWSWGIGSATDTSFSITLPAPPPPEIQPFGAAIGWLTMFPDGAAPPEGEYTVPGTPDWIGMSRQHLVLYKPQPISTTDTPWLNDAPLGWSCLQCVPSGPVGLDDLTQVDCSQVVLYLEGDPSAPEPCNPF